MARPGITAEQVAAAAEALAAEGVAVTIKAVLARLGSGSETTILKHLRAWRDSRPAAQAAAPELPPHIAAALSAELARVAAEAREPLVSQLASQREETDGVIAESDRRADVIDELTEQLAAVTTERDQAAALAGERADEIRRLSEALAVEREAKDKLVLEAATLKLKTDAQTEQVTELKAALKTAQTALDEASKGRQTAETKLAGIEAKEAAERTRADDLATRLKAAQEQVTTATADAKTAAQEAKASASAAAKAHADAKEAQAAATAAARELSATQEALKVAQAAAQTAQGEAAGLQGQLTELRAQLAAALASDDELKQLAVSLDKPKK